MAQQLREQGQEIAFLALCDTNISGGRLATSDTHSRRNRLLRKGQRLRHYGVALTQLTGGDIKPYLAMKTRNAMAKFMRSMRHRLDQVPGLTRLLPTDLPTDLHNTQAEDYLTVEPYTPKPYAGRLTCSKRVCRERASFTTRTWVGESSSLVGWIIM